MMLNVFNKLFTHQTSHTITMNILFIVVALLIADILFSVVKSRLYSSDSTYNNKHDNMQNTMQKNTENNFPGLVQEDMLNNFINEAYNKYYVNLNSCYNVDDADNNDISFIHSSAGLSYCCFVCNTDTIDVIVNPVYSFLPCNIFYND